MTFSMADVNTERNALRALATANAPLGSYPLPADLLVRYPTMNPQDGQRFVDMVRESCPAGYLVPFMTTDVEGRLTMMKWNGVLFHVALRALIRDLKYCLTRLRRIVRNLKRLRAGIPASDPIIAVLDGVVAQLDAITVPMGILPLAIRALPGVARRAAQVERDYLRDLANWAAA